jgi:hypothetical protein
MLSTEQQQLLHELKEFLYSVAPDALPGRPGWRDTLITRINETLAKDAEYDATMSGIKGALTRWLSKR